jgi:hypothetical protein
VRCRHLEGLEKARDFRRVGQGDERHLPKSSENQEMKPHADRKGEMAASESIWPGV